MDEKTLTDKFAGFVNQGHLEAALDLFHEESWDKNNRVYGKKAIHTYLKKFIDSLDPDAHVCYGRLGSQPVAYVETPGKLGSIARYGYWWIVAKEGLIGELYWEFDHARASLIVPEESERVEKEK